MENAEEDQQQSAKADEVDPETALAGIAEEQQRGTIHAFYKEENGEGDEEEIASFAPKTEEEHSRGKRKRRNYAEHERYDHLELLSQISP
jgi:hypothetical protein